MRPRPCGVVANGNFKICREDTILLRSGAQPVIVRLQYIVSELGEICRYLASLWLVWPRRNHSINTRFTHPRNKILKSSYCPSTSHGSAHLVPPVHLYQIGLLYDEMLLQRRQHANKYPSCLEVERNTIVPQRGRILPQNTQAPYCTS